MSKVLVIQTDERWNEQKKRWFDLEPSNDIILADVKYVCIYNGDGTGGAMDHGGCVLKIKEWLKAEHNGQLQWAVGVGAYSVQPGHILRNWGLVKKGITDLEYGSLKSPGRFESELKWTEIPVGPRELDFANVAIDLKTAKCSIAKFYGVSPDQVSIRIQS
ncbi:hypothetical protein [Pseudomonas fluorescens]|uniref:hypothetical protein n=1 Tax=Pseudomonas fluorescens TaxID=294 RepID=UPI0014734CFC|nr:hypothetical protein [Pseudomonas fluorescens]NNB66982.1 hypothetical protein [Pseudomonas fluorescens]